MGEMEEREEDKVVEDKLEMDKPEKDNVVENKLLEDNLIVRPICGWTPKKEDKRQKEKPFLKEIRL